MTFFDSVHGLPCYQIGGAGRSWEEFERESCAHGWPSFRDGEVHWEHVRVLADGEVVSVRGAHLGHNLADVRGNRHCINLVAIAGRPLAAAETMVAAVKLPPSPRPTTATAPPVKKPSPGSSGAGKLAQTSSESVDIADGYDGPWPDLPPVSIVPLSGEATVVGHEHRCAAECIAHVVRGRLGPRAVVSGDWRADVSAAVILFVVEVERHPSSSTPKRGLPDCMLMAV